MQFYSHKYHLIMRRLKHIITLFLIALLVWACSSLPVKNSSKEKEEPVIIANDSLEYQVIIIDPGFTFYLASTAHPEGYYSQNYLETRNQFYVTTWNSRVRNASRFNPNIYENIIDYQPTVDYGYEVNYKLFNYFLFAQRKYRMSLGVGRSGQIR